MCTCRGRRGATKAACMPSLNGTLLPAWGCVCTYPFSIPEASPIPGYPMTLKWPGPTPMCSPCHGLSAGRQWTTGNTLCTPFFLRPHRTEGGCLGCLPVSVSSSREGGHDPSPSSTSSAPHDRNCSPQRAVTMDHLVNVPSLGCAWRQSYLIRWLSL